MKKIFSKILGCTLAVSVMASGLVGCGDTENKWTEPTLTNWGASISATNGGFTAETENYVYYVNGIPTETAENSFGTPIKGTLMAMDKSNPTKTEIVVPKLFAASDYNAGFAIVGDYVYYGTPNTDKAPDGTIANNELVFERTKLNGKENQRLFVAGSEIATEYRIVVNGEDVYIVYYDTEDTALKAFDVTNNQEIVIAKTDAEAEGDYSLSEYKFVTDANGEVAVVYTVSVFSEPYIEDKAEQEGYVRATKNYNLMMVYKAGDQANEKTGMLGKLVLDGEANGETYAFTFLNKDKVFFTATPISGAVKTYGAVAPSLYATSAKAEIKNADYLVKETLFKSLDEVYSYADGKLYKSSLIQKDAEAKRVVAIPTECSLIYDVIGNDVYYLNSANEMMRMELNNEDAEEIRVSEGALFTGWFSPEMVNFGGKTYMFYIDDTATGLSYTNYVDVDATVVEEDTDEDGEIDIRHLGDSIFVGIKTEEDKAAIVGALIDEVADDTEKGSVNALNLKKEEETGELYNESLRKAEEEYEKLSENTKKLVSEEKMTAFNRYKKAVEMANVYAEIEGIIGYHTKSEDEQLAVETAYESVKAEILAFIQSEDYENIHKYIPTNIKAYFTLAQKEFKD